MEKIKEFLRIETGDGSGSGSGDGYGYGDGSNIQKILKMEDI